MKKHTSLLLALQYEGSLSLFTDFVWCLAGGVASFCQCFFLLLSLENLHRLWISVSWTQEPADLSLASLWYVLKRLSNQSYLLQKLFFLICNKKSSKKGTGYQFDWLTCLVSFYADMQAFRRCWFFHPLFYTSSLVRNGKSRIGKTGLLSMTSSHKLLTKIKHPCIA